MLSIQEENLENMFLKQPSETKKNIHKQEIKPKPIQFLKINEKK